MIIDENNTLHIIADEGKVLQRIKDGVIVGKEHFLKEIYNIGCMILDEPYMETVDDFKEIPKPVIIEDDSDEEIKPSKHTYKRNNNDDLDI